MAITLPSRNVIYIFFACAIVVAGIVIAHNILAPRPEAAAPQAKADPAIRSSAFSVVKNAFTKEALDQASALADESAATSTAATSSAPQTATEKFSRLILTQYMAAKQAKGTLTDQDLSDLATSVMNAPIPTPGPRVYVRADIKTIDATPAQLHAYGNSLVKIFEANISPDTGQELYIVNDILESQNEAKGARLKGISAYYKNMIDQTLAIPAPDIAAQSLLDYVNALSALRLSIENMGKVISDPILAVKGIDQREGFAEAAVMNLEAIGTILKLHGVTYATSEKGAELSGGQ